MTNFQKIIMFLGVMQDLSITINYLSTRLTCLNAPVDM
ncbi:MAG: hypothetical protein BWY14_00196 [Parcubacteria group bacterium ADurb.Bin192]|nr:MAG: hypothetical protein BWY14_00196 [Parcubacteria group bacterium ADurb.Bin192]